MRYSLISAIATLGSVVMAQPVVRSVTSPQVCDSLKVLKEKAQKLQVSCQGTEWDAHSIAIGHGAFSIIAGNGDMLLAGTKTLSDLEGTNPFTAEECTAITDSFKEFSAAQQVYLNLLAGKSVVLTKAPLATVGPSVAVSLTNLKDVYTKLDTKLISLCASKAEELTSEAKTFEATLDSAISKYGSVGKIPILPN
ncbi:hypothetical protein NEUTE1DRAFT_113532 [Neurospora tetrasperma FGSC 2508]|uniref:Uncharacterized protein n=1 Tax=Neurospora tetrasperma (strain FGSC 2508 / ATCC MYA-4615 / P0657) TaxID=510951 RepID=F8MYQ9_NEUT8|nr:uncharacterized protein NEUTE1DRAFT_113532 [Neurospora tetrasperma FGSC 2508]EGO51456.1 hypothetical protein NEUTE1DRAFT_113532 [Neurospora tetrasperma FGSC 2508]EGZ78562.1 hypothetical protein NEUTE2DRAFT_52373 [Neurospora tetrasperma FGSC 2509]